MTTPRVNILGTEISVLNLESAKEILRHTASNPQHLGYVTVTGVHGVVESQHDPELQKIHNDSFLSTPDGMPMVWLGKAYGHHTMGRVYGPDLMAEVLHETQGSGLSHYFYGGNEGVAEELRQKVLSKYPQTNIAGTYTPPFRPLNQEEEAALLADLHQCRPHFLWVGLSTPKQERFMNAFLQKHPDLNKDWNHGFTMLGVGAAFDFLSGRVGQAPSVIQRSGFEWLYRVYQEPQRLWKRYAINNTKFIFSILGQLLRYGSNPPSAK